MSSVDGLNTPGVRMVYNSLWTWLYHGITYCRSAHVSDVRRFLDVPFTPKRNNASRICWPFDIDQPAQAALVSTLHHVGYELFEVRNEHGLLPIRRLGDKTHRGTVDAVREEIQAVLELARGKDGDEKRAKAQWFAKHFEGAWDKGGSAQQALEKLLTFI
jgi:hypothetical protein